MDRPPVNALHVQGWFDLAHALDRAGPDPAVPAVVRLADGRRVRAREGVEDVLLAGGLGLGGRGLGSLAAWLVVTQLFEFDWLPDWLTVLAVLGLGIAVVLVFAVLGSFPLLRAKPAQALRTL